MSEQRTQDASDPVCTVTIRDVDGMQNAEPEVDDTGEPHATWRLSRGERSDGQKENERDGSFKVFHVRCADHRALILRSARRKTQGLTGDTPPASCSSTSPTLCLGAASSALNCAFMPAANGSPAQSGGSSSGNRSVREAPDHRSSLIRMAVRLDVARSQPVLGR